MAAEKVVPRRSGSRAWMMTWATPARDRYHLRAPIERDAVQIGELQAWVNATLKRQWWLKLQLRGEEVFRWDFAEPPCKHRNPPNGVCPPGFPRRVRDCEQEHVWVEGWDVQCARRLEGLCTSGFREIFGAFCDRTHIEFQPDYIAPLALAQMRFPDNVLDQQ